MPFSLFRYYYFLEDDAARAENFMQHLTGQGFVSGPVGFKPEKRVNRLLYGNMVIIVAALNGEADWDFAQVSLDDWESQAGINPYLLARVTVLHDSEDSYEDALKLAAGICPYRETIPFDIKQGRLARLDWRWPHGQAFYLYSESAPGLAAVNFFNSGLPLLEGALIRLNMVNNLYRDRHAIVEKERREIDMRLSQVLHTQLVSDKAPLKEVEELQKQIQELSASYGILAGDYGSLSEASGTLQELVKNLVQHVKSQSFLLLQPEILNTILRPYQERLNRLQKSQDDLRISRENHQAAIDVVRSRIDIMVSRENIETQERIKDLMEINTSIQKQSLVFQVAAGIIEFIVLAYYSHSLWKSLAHNAYALIPPWLQFIAVLLFSFATVEVTHLVAEYRQGDHHVKGKLLVYGIGLFLLLSLIITASVIMEGKAAH